MSERVSEFAIVSDSPFIALHVSTGQKERWGNYAPAFGTKKSGIVWVTNISYDWLKVALGNHQPIVTYTGPLDGSRKPKADAQSPWSFWSSK